MEDYRPFKSSPSQLKDWFSSIMWQDFKSELESWIQELHGILEHDNTRNIVDVARAQGSIRSLREVLQLEETLPANAESIEKLTKEK